MPTTIEILEDLKLTELPADEQNKVLAQVTEILQNRVAMRVDDLLSDEEKAEFDKVAAAGNQQEMDRYLDEKIPDLSGIAAEEYQILRAELVSKNEMVLAAFEEAAKKVK